MVTFLGLDLTIWLVGAAIAIATYYWNQLFLNHYWKTKNVPSDGPGTMVGKLVNLYLKGKSLLDLEQEQYIKHGKVCGIYVANKPVIMVGEPELLRLILVKDFQKFPERRPFTPNIILRSSLLGLSGDNWKRVRPIVGNMFTSVNLRKMSSLITKHAKSITETFLQKADSKTNVELTKLFAGFSIDCIASAAYGTEPDSNRTPESMFATKARELFDGGFNWKSVLFRLAPRLLKKLGITFSEHELITYFADFILNIREQRMNGVGKDHDDFLKMLMDIESATSKSTEENDETNVGSPEGEIKFTGQEKLKKTLSRTELVGLSVMFMLVGFHTTAIALVLTCYLLAQNQKCQERLHKEVDEIWEEHQGSIDYDTANSMKYLDAVISEVLRMYPPVESFTRKSEGEYKLGSTGITIPMGMLVEVPVYALHRDPEFFPDPDIFKPERFLAENKDSIKPYTYLPFGSGPRNCVAIKFANMEMKHCLINILRHVSFHTCAETEIPLKYYNRRGEVLPKKVIVRLERRH